MIGQRGIELTTEYFFKIKYDSQSIKMLSIVHHSYQYSNYSLKNVYTNFKFKFKFNCLFKKEIYIDIEIFLQLVMIKIYLLTCLRILSGEAAIRSF